MKLILASASTSRAAILRSAGVPTEVHPAQIDESSIKNRMHGSDGDTIAAKLAELKALRISTLHPQDLVLGADQLLILNGNLFSKAETLDTAETQLRALRGKSHQLTNALLLAHAGKPVWQYTDHATLWMRDFSDDFLKHYLITEKDSVLGSVGCYRLEGVGVQLFERIEGDYFSILGLPLLPLLAVLRDYGMLQL